MPLILKFIKHKTIIYSDAWAVYRGLEDSEYTHGLRVINHSEYFVDPEHKSIHTQKKKNTSGAILRNGSRGLVSGLSVFQVIPSCDS